MLQAVGAIVLRQQKVLLLQEGENKEWKTPGGGVEAGELLPQALERECLIQDLEQLQLLA